MKFKKIHILSLTQIITGILMVIAAEADSSLWYIPGVLWLILCVIGVVLTIPLICVIFIAAGGAQVDWMSDTFTIIVFFVIPTTLSVLVNYGIVALSMRAEAREKIEIAPPQ